MSQNKEKLKIKIVLPRFYSLLALAFFLFTLALGAGFIYYVFGKARIVITPTYEKLSRETTVDIRENANMEAPGSKIVPGKLFVFEVEDRVSVPSTGEKAIMSNGIGSVKLINNSPNSQPLVATTRLLAPDGTLLRLKDRVVVPAMGSMEANVYPDKPELFTKLSPTRLVLPGLAENLKNKIYAENNSILSAGEKMIRTVAKDDINNIDRSIIEALSSTVDEKSKEFFKDNSTLYTQLVYKEVIDKKIDAKEGDEKELFGVEAKVRAVAVQFDEKRIVEYLKKDIAHTLPAGKILKDIDPKSIVYAIEKYNIDNGSVQMKIFMEGRVQVKQDNKIFDKKMIFGKSRGAIEKYFQGFGEIEKVNVEFFPSWIPRAPRSDEKIDIVIE